MFGLLESHSEDAMIVTSESQVTDSKNEAFVIAKSSVATVAPTIAAKTTCVGAKRRLEFFFHIDSHVAKVGFVAPKCKSVRKPMRCPEDDDSNRCFKKSQTAATLRRLKSYGWRSVCTEAPIQLESKLSL